ncbi:hypothetical protein GCM10023210_31030 [Chryseobacterium ginsengisoli]|uniref:Uncharacterized protein n=1 Tax=Chryseobacterium ginsengisoli TaxID=363853 RepID=A0ABP9MI63_9FLAO
MLKKRKTPLTDLFGERELLRNTPIKNTSQNPTEKTKSHNGRNSRTKNTIR